MAMPHKGAAALIMRCRLMLAVRLLWECRGGIRDGSGRNDAKPCRACVCGIFPDCRKRHKAALTTGMTTDRKNFILPFAVVSWQKSEYPGVAQLVGRDIWDVEVGCSSHLTRTKIPLKSTISEGFSYSLSIAAQTLSLSFLTCLFDKRRLNIVIFCRIAV